MPSNIEHSLKIPTPLLPTTHPKNGRRGKQSPIISNLQQVTSCTTSLLREHERSWSADNDEEITGLSEVLSQGAALRLEAEALGSVAERPVGLKLNGGLLKRGLIALGLLSGIKGLVGTGYRDYQASDSTGGKAGNATQPGDSYPSLTPYIPGMGGGGVLEDSFGNHALHHDGATSVPRRGRRHHLDNSTQVSTSPVLTSNKKPITPMLEATRKINHILRKKGYLKHGKVTKEEQLGALANHLLISQYQYGRSKELIQIARIILAADQLYGGESHEALSEEQAKSVVRQWVFKQVLGMSPAEFIASQLRTAADPETFTVTDLYNQLSSFNLFDTNYLAPWQFPPKQMEFFSGLWYEFLLAEIPIIRIRNWPDVCDIKVNSFEFANLYTGIQFLDQLSVKNFIYEEALQVGEKAWALAVNSGVTEDQIGLFSTPAIFALASDDSQLNSTTIPSPISAINQYIEYRTKIIAAEQDIKQKYNSYLSAAKAWITKGALADHIIAQCEVIKDPSLPELFVYNPSQESKRKYAERVAKQRYLNESGRPCENAPKSLDTEYRKLTSKVADSFRALDKYLIPAALHTLPKDELKFILSPQAKLSLVQARPILEHVPQFHTHFHYSRAVARLDSALAGTDLIIVTLGTEKRLYTLSGIQNNGDGYRISRMNLDARNVTDWHGGSEKKITAYKAPEQWKVDEFTIAAETALLGTGDRTEILAGALSKKHRDNLYNSLYTSGNDQSDLQKIWAVIKHFIPFYDCVEGIVNHDVVQAVPACLIDAVAFIPVFGQAAKLSGRFGISVSRGIIRSLAESSEKGVAVLVQNVLKDVSLPTTRELGVLGKTTLQALDPGFGLLISSNKVFAKKLFNSLSRDQKTAQLSSALISETVLGKLTAKKILSPITIKIPQSTVNIPVKVTGKLENGDNVYVRLNPATGECFGKKFIFDENVGLIYQFTKEINLHNSENLVTGIQNWNVFKHDEKQKGRLIPHDSGFYTSFDSQGKPTGYLFLVRKQGAIPVTELYQDKYYMIGEGANRVVIRKSQENGIFEFIGPATKDKLKVGEYLDNSWCSSKLRIKRQINGVEEAACATGNQPELVHKSVTIRHQLGIEDSDKVLDFAIKYRGFWGMESAARVRAIDHLQDALLYENTDMVLQQSEIDMEAYMEVFSDKNIALTKDDAVFKDSTDVSVSISDDAVTLTKYEKIALRRWTASDREVTYFHDGMPPLNQAGIKSNYQQLNHRLAKNLPINEDERNAIRLLNSALEKLPTQEGDFVRIASYDVPTTPWDGYLPVAPWDTSFKIGDIVTNFPCYMSVASSQKFMRKFYDAKGAKSTVIYRFENTRSSRPLLEGYATTLDENENLFRRDSAFKVKHIGTVKDVKPIIEIRPKFNKLGEKLAKKRVVVLEEVDIPTNRKAKNIYSAKEVTIDT